MIIQQDKTPTRSIKQYQNNNGVVMFVDDTQNWQTTVSYCTVSGEIIPNDDIRALTFFNNGPYLVMELKEELREHE